MRLGEERDELLKCQMIGIQMLICFSGEIGLLMYVFLFHSSRNYPFLRALLSNKEDGRAKQPEKRTDREFKVA